MTYIILVWGIMIHFLIRKYMFVNLMKRQHTVCVELLTEVWVFTILTFNIDCAHSKHSLGTYLLF